MLFATEARVVPGPALYLARADTAFDAEGQLTQDSARETLRQILQALQRVQPGGETAL